MNLTSMLDFYFPTILQYYILWRNTFITWSREIPVQMIDGKAPNLCTCKYKVWATLEFSLFTTKQYFPSIKHWPV